MTNLLFNVISTITQLRFFAFISNIGILWFANNYYFSFLVVTNTGSEPRVEVGRILEALCLARITPSHLSPVSSTVQFETNNKCLPPFLISIPLLLPIDGRFMLAEDRLFTVSFNVADTARITEYITSGAFSNDIATCKSWFLRSGISLSHFDTKGQPDKKLEFNILNDASPISAPGAVLPVNLQPWFVGTHGFSIGYSWLMFNFFFPYITTDFCDFRSLQGWTSRAGATIGIPQVQHMLVLCLDWYYNGNIVKPKNNRVFETNNSAPSGGTTYTPPVPPSSGTNAQPPASTPPSATTASVSTAAQSAAQEQQAPPSNATTQQQNTGRQQQGRGQPGRGRGRTGQRPPSNNRQDQRPDDRSNTGGGKLETRRNLLLDTRNRPTNSTSHRQFNQTGKRFNQAILAFNNAMNYS